MFPTLTLSKPFVHNHHAQYSYRQKKSFKHPSQKNRPGRRQHSKNQPGVSTRQDPIWLRLWRLSLRDAVGNTKSLAEPENMRWI